MKSTQAKKTATKKQGVTKKPTSKQSTFVLQLKVTLVGAQPNIWRRIVVLSDSLFFDLHVAAQDAFEWEDSHLHQFFTTSPFKRNAQYETISFPMPGGDPFGFGDKEDLDERKTLVAKYLREPKDTVYYEYDFGDSWMHEIKLEKVLPRETGVKYPLLIDGKNATPPEDSGGVGGYYDLLEIINSPKHPEREGMMEWMGIEEGETFDPEAFDPNAVRFHDPKKRLKEYERNFR